MHKVLSVIFLSLFVLLLGMMPLSAAEVEVGVAPVWWQYEEMSGQRPGFAGTPFYSSANGYGMQASMMVEWEVNDQWLPSVSLEGLIPLNKAVETWGFTGGGQTNRLDITQFEARGDLHYQFGMLDAGVWLSYQWHQQSRRQFVVNGMPVVVVGEPVHETVQSFWAGIALASSFGKEAVSIYVDAALPVWVYTTNSLIPEVFSRTNGFRVGAGVEWNMPWSMGAAQLSGSLSYRYRELGNDLRRIALWPKNRWQMVSLGAKLTW